MKRTIELHLGKTPARPDAVTFKLERYLDPKALPKPPKQFGFENVIGANQWGMLGNDRYGDCVIAGAYHETELFNAIAKKTVRATDAEALKTYGLITGFRPDDPNTDQGTDMSVAAAYRRNTGIVDADGKVHKILAYLAGKPGDLAQYQLALWLFKAVGTGYEMPTYAMDQFNAGKPWDVQRGGKIEGGHYVPGVAKRTNLEGVSWARLQGITARFFGKFNDEWIVYVTDEDQVNGLDPDGFDTPTLLKDLAALKK